MEIINNIITVANTGSVELDTDVLYVREQCALGRKASHEVARRLLKIKREELFTVCADNFSDFCTNYFGINKATGSKLTALAERFLVDENGNEDNSYDDFSISQLMEIRNASTEQLKLIKPTMTVKEIRDILHPKKELPDNSENSADSCDTETNDNKSDKLNTKLDPEKAKSMVEICEPAVGDGVTSTKLKGDGFEIILKDNNSFDHAHITTFEGLKNFYDYISSKFTPEIIENNVKVNVVIEM